MLRRDELDSLFREQRERVLALAFHMTGDRSLAGDVLQETFLRAWRFRRSFRRDSASTTWLYRIAIRESIRARATLRRGAKPRSISDSESGASGSAGQDPDAERRARLARALLQLSDEHRTVLTLLTLRGMTAEVVGEIIGIPANTVYSRAAAARARLRSKLAVADAD